MWFEFIVNGCAPIFTAMSAARDAGIWFIQMNAPYISNYMESSLIEKGRL